MERALASITALLHRADSGEPPFPPTLLFEEGWMLRLVLDWFATSGAVGHALSFAPGARWFSEARLAPPFPRVPGGGRPGEGYTNADGVIGHFYFAQDKKADLHLDPDARQFVVVEAKMLSGLSKGTTRAPGYNQAARNVACMAKVVGRDLGDGACLDRLGFYVLAPREKLDEDRFEDVMEKSSLARVVRERVEGYDPAMSDWYDRRFRPTLDAMEISCLAWEDVIEVIQRVMPDFGAALARFYDRCLVFNQAVARQGR